ENNSNDGDENSSNDGDENSSNDGDVNDYQNNSDYSVSEKINKSKSKNLIKLNNSYKSNNKYEYDSNNSSGYDSIDSNLIINILKYDKQKDNKDTIKNDLEKLLSCNNNCSVENHNEEKKLFINHVQMLCYLIKHKKINSNKNIMKTWEKKKYDFKCCQLQKAYKIFLTIIYSIVKEIKKLRKELKCMRNYIFINLDIEKYLNENNMSIIKNKINDVNDVVKNGSSKDNRENNSNSYSNNIITDFFLKKNFCTTINGKECEKKKIYISYVSLDNYQILFYSLKDIVRIKNIQKHLKKISYYIEYNIDEGVTPSIAPTSAVGTFTHSTNFTNTGMDVVTNSDADNGNKNKTTTSTGIGTGIGTGTGTGMGTSRNVNIPNYCSMFYEKFKIKEYDLYHIQSLFNCSIPTVECMNMFISCLNCNYKKVYQKKNILQNELSADYLYTLPSVYCCEIQIIKHQDFIDLKETCQNLIKKKNIYEKLLYHKRTYIYDDCYFIIPFFTSYGNFLIIIQINKKGSLNSSTRDTNLFTYDFIINSYVFPNNSSFQAIVHFTYSFIKSLKKCFKTRKSDENVPNITYLNLPHVNKEKLIYKTVESSKNRNEIVINMMFLIESFFNNTQKIKPPIEFNEGLRFLYMIRLLEFFHERG
ncbi:conserved protein, unknown function, partial [Hepatocystis sp. ex Piliocolobus tephrosceles]